MTSILEKGGGTFEGVKLLLCENPLPPIDEAIAAAQGEVPLSNYYTEPFSEPLRRFIADSIGIPERLVHINAGSELILRQLFDRLGQRVHLLTPTYPLFPEIAERYTETRLLPEKDFSFDLAGFRVGYAILPEALADDLNTHNDAYPLARPSQAAALATLQHEDKIRERATRLRTWTEQLARELRTLGVRTYPTETYFFLADFAPRDAVELAARLQERGIFIKPLGDPGLAPGFMRVTTALPDDNTRVVQALRELL